MICSMKEVEMLIPHRDPFLYVDQLTSLSKDEIVGEKTFCNSDEFLKGSFPDFNFVPGVILIEAMAQCGGAGMKKLTSAQGLFALANIENATFFKGVPYQACFKMVVKNVKVSEKYIKQTGIGYVDNEPCVELTWTCIRFE
jgi:3-hydroxyacyl-[acyl-carrier-protein] dehydratase